MSFGDTFVRDIQIRPDISLNIHQLGLGDVGACVWDAALVLIKYFETDAFYVGNRHVFEGAEIVDLGSGTGAVGLAAAALGGNVKLTDLSHLTSLLKHNAKENENVAKGRVEVLALKWGEDIKLEKKPAFILVADCLYYDQSVEPLLKTLDDLSDSNSTILFSFEDRSNQGKEEVQRKFFQGLRRKFCVEAVPFFQLHPEMRSEDIKVFKFKKKN